MADREPLAEALRAELLKLAADGDPKEGGALTAEILLRIMRVAKTGRELLVSLAAAPSSLAALVRRPKPYSLFGGPAADYDDPEDGAGGALPYAVSPSSENFGMTAIREIIAAAKNLNGTTSPAKIVEAIALAREKGLDDVARDLEGQLGIGTKKPALEMTLEPKEKEILS